MILLDNQSAVDLLCNCRLVSRAWKTDETMTAHGNGGTLTINMKAHVLNHGDIWFDASASTNILSLKNVREKSCVTHDSRNGDGAFVARKPSRSDAHFVVRANGLRHRGTSNCQLAMVLTVKEESEGFSKRQIVEAKKARVLQGVVGHPSTSDLKWIVNSNLIRNYPVTAEHIDRAEKTRGPSLPALKGKTSRQSPLQVASDHVAIPPPIFSANKHVMLSGDPFFVNLFPFFAPISDHVKFATAKFIPNWKIAQLVQASKHAQAVCSSGGFRIKHALMDGEFVPMKLRRMTRASPKTNLSISDSALPQLVQ